MSSRPISSTGLSDEGSTIVQSMESATYNPSTSVPSQPTGGEEVVFHINTMRGQWIRFHEASLMAVVLPTWKNTDFTAAGTAGAAGQVWVAMRAADKKPFMHLGDSEVDW